MISFPDQLARVLEAAYAVRAEADAQPQRVPLHDALGLVLAEDVHTPVPLPGFDNSAMDGFAVRRDDVLGASADAPVTLRVVADIPAGSGLDPRLQPGECARIMTGSPVPADADAVVPFEHTVQGVAITEQAAPTVEVTIEPKPAANIRRAGEDAPAGALIAEACERLGARILSGIAAAGVAEVAVVRAPRVAIITTGDEVVAPGGTVAHGQIFDSNTTLVAGLVRECGAEVALQTHVGDGGTEFADAVARAAEAEADVIVTTGGVSVGAFDVVRLVLSGAGDNDEPSGVAFDKVAMQPGKPQGFGRLASGQLVFALPGNPVSVFTSFEAFVKPTLRILAGEEFARRTSTATAAEGWRTPPGRAQFMPVRSLTSGEVVRATAGGSGSHLVSRLAAAEALALVPAESEEVRPGDRLTIWEILP
ncbi:molybdopterin molybdotransferase MoeA [Gulosibacter molinativorax]|uniref:Molybdopterin molybdenumtransferase n=1 Tax=Gulosibacter molinativorax TaxID=256821 RepID=A0ABT7CAX9_9MICO|nr:gephyrin-like molybdotransferase Glp [Gulosibacter molinativorax]MDJ1372352.1 molybdopterin molybdenumtransferase MoeA [Gulosibacter molinativorax]QUY63558.1 Molybdopterin molybdenumtransferase [Gulosibacter molinativorax]